MNSTGLRSVCLCVLALTMSAACAVAENNDGGLRYRAVDANGNQFSGVSAGVANGSSSPANFGTAVAQVPQMALDQAAKALSPVLDDVIGYDQRVYVQNTTDFPHRAIGFLSTACTGTLIGPRHVLTAAHCVYSVNSNQWYTGITFAPARNGNSEPYGEYAMQTVYAPQNYTDNHDTNYDYALIVLQQPIGNQTGWVAYQYDNSINQTDIHIVGYPSDLGTGTQQFESQCNVDDSNSLTFQYRCSTSGGMSGSSVWSLEGNVPTVHGIHVYALHDASGASFANSATRITSTVFEQLQYWVSRHP